MTLRVLSLGAGVQSTTLALMAAAGEIEPPDCAIFADTGAEPRAVYDHLAWLRSPGVLPFPVHVISAGNLREAVMGRQGKRDTWGRPPFYMPTADGWGAGQLNRQCTRSYKVDPILKEVRTLLGIKPRSPGPKRPVCEMFIGISTDEASRMKPSRKRYITNRWPLIEQGISRSGCIGWLAANGYERPPKSACTFCPYHSNEHWKTMKAADPVSFAEAVEVDRAIRNWPGQTSGALFVHRSLRPLEEVDFTRWQDRNQPDLFGNECEGLCGV